MHTILWLIITMPFTNINQQTMSPKEFEELVIHYGGVINFVFSEDKPFKECHASTLVETANGDILCAWFGGTKEKHPDVAIWLASWNGKEWSKLIKIAKVKEEAHWNPVLFRDQDNILYLFFKVGKDVPHWSTYWINSTDHGKTWSNPTELVPGDIGGRGPVKNKPIILHDGTWLAPASTELKGWKCFVDRTSDKGKTWTRTQDWEIDTSHIKGKGVIQPTLWESEPGKIHAFMRSTSGCIAYSESTDNGLTWSKVTCSQLPNNNSGIDLIKNQYGLWLVYNPIASNWGPRNPLTLALSTDNGKTWKQIAHLEKDAIPIAEYSYPAIINTTKGVAISYTWKRERIRYWEIPNPLLEKLSKDSF